MDWYAFFPFEVIGRELGYISNIAKILKSKGYSVVIGHQAGLIPTVLRGDYRGSLIFLKSIDGAKSKIVGRLQEAGLSINVIDSESIFVNPKMFAKFRLTERNLGHCDNYFIPGKYQKDLLDSEYPDLADRFVCCGNFRIFENANHIKPQSKSINKKTILICTGFAFWNHYLGVDKQDSLIKGYLSNEQLYQEFYSDFTQLAQNAKTELFSYISLVFKISEKFSDLHLIIRVHPSEDKSIWSEICRLCPNVELDQIVDTNTSLLQADLIISHPSTILLESFYKKIPSICFEKENYTQGYSAYSHGHPQSIAQYYKNDHESVLHLLSQDSTYNWQFTNKQRHVLSLISSSFSETDFSRRFHQQKREYNQKNMKNSASRILILYYFFTLVSLLGSFRFGGVKSVSYGLLKMRNNESMTIKNLLNGSFLGFRFL